MDGVAGRLAPVPGGAGPMTIAPPMVNTLRASSPTPSPTRRGVDRPRDLDAVRVAAEWSASRRRPPGT
nr:hypothetical protein [Streptomyces olivochromogenes]